MRVLLRMAGLWFGLQALVLALLAFHGLELMLKLPSVRAGLVLGGVSLALAVTVFACIQLLRLCASGRSAGIALTIASLAFMCVQPGGPTRREAVPLAVSLSVLVLLLTPAAGRACRSRSAG